MISMPAKINLEEGTWIRLKPAAPLHLRKFASSPAQIVKRINRQLFLRGQQDFQISIAVALKHFEPAPNLKISQ